MATPAEHQYEAVLALATKANAVLEVAHRYMRLLGDDRGRAARISRRSHLGLFEQTVATLAEEWRQRDPAVYDDALRRAFTETDLARIVGYLGGQSEKAIDAWDDGVREFEAQAAALVRVIRAYLGGAQSEPAVPDYELSGELGRGGFGAVYLGRDSAGVERAIKILAPSALAPQVNAGDRFQREAELLGRAEHRGVVRYIKLGHSVSGTYLVMELILGRPLSSWARDQDDATRVGAILDALDALQHLHELGIIHRDLKPSNILVEDGTNRVVIVDLGLAWMMDGPTSTMTQASAWSAAYAPPEVLADPRASRGPKHDIYSMGVVLYEILAGQRPLIGHRVPLARHRETLVAIDAVVDRALAHVDGRFDTASAFATALREARAGLESPWHSPMVVGSEIGTATVRDLVLEIAQRGADGDLGGAAIAVAGVADAIRIHVTREYRLARGLDTSQHERLMPAVISSGAAMLFPDAPRLHAEPRLAKDEYGEAAVSRLGFGMGELAVFKRADEYATAVLRAHEREGNVDTMPSPPGARDVASALTALASKLKELEQREPEVIRSFAELIPHAES